MSLASSLVAKVKALFRRGKPVTADPETGRALRDAVASQGNADASELARRLAAKEVTATTFQEELYLLTRRAHIAQFSLARGGMDALTAADRATLSRLIGEQAGYLREFVGEIGKGELTAEEIAQRAALYPESAIGAYEAGHAASMDVAPPALPPAHPRCRCHAAYGEEGGKRTFTWVTSEDERVCDICAGLAVQYDRYVIRATA